MLGAAIVSIVAGIIYLLSESQASVAAAFIAINNVALPKLMQLLMHKPGGGEHHHTHSTHEVIRPCVALSCLVLSCPLSAAASDLLCSQSPSRLSCVQGASQNPLCTCPKQTDLGFGCSTCSKPVARFSRRVTEVLHEVW